MSDSADETSSGRETKSNLIMNFDLLEPPGNVTYSTDTLRRQTDHTDQIELRIRNTGDHLVQVGSHYHLFEANPALAFDRITAFGKRLDLPPGDRIAFPPGETLTVTAVPFEGDRRIRSYYGVVDGSLNECDPTVALERFRDRVEEPLAEPQEVTQRG